MKKDLRSRLNELAWDITSIGNFNYAQEYGHKIESIQNLAERVASELPGVYEVMSSTYPIVEVVYPDAIDSIDPNKITKWKKEVGRILTQLREDPSYIELLKAYNNDDQKEIAEILPNVFVNFATDKLIEPGQKSPPLFHGITVPKKMSAEEYLELCLRMQREGIKPSPYGLHMDMDRNIRPVFSALNPYEAHGLIALTFRPTDHTVVIENNDSEARIYSKRLKAKFGLVLRDAETLVSYSPGNDVGVPRDKTEGYVKDLTNLLNERKIPFKRISLPSD